MTLSSGEASLCHREVKEREKEKTQGTMGRIIGIAAEASEEEKGPMTF